LAITALEPSKKNFSLKHENAAAQRPTKQGRAHNRPSPKGKKDTTTFDHRVSTDQPPQTMARGPLHQPRKDSSPEAIRFKKRNGGGEKKNFATKGSRGDRPGLEIGEGMFTKTTPFQGKKTDLDDAKIKKRGKGDRPQVTGTRGQAGFNSEKTVSIQQCFIGK